jgi:signal transduction histidine kinase
MVRRILKKKIAACMNRLLRFTFQVRENLKLQLLASIFLCLGLACGAFFLLHAGIRTYRLSRFDGDRVDVKLAELIRDFQTQVSKEGLRSTDTTAIERWGREKGVTIFNVKFDSGNFTSLDAALAGFAPEGPAFLLPTVIRYRDGEVGVWFLYTPLRSLRFVSWVVSLLLAFDIFLVSLFFVLRKKLDYILRIERGIAVLESGTLGYTVPVEGTDELARLATSINLLSRSIQSRIDSEQKALQANREMIGDLSHDIRTPLTVGMGYLTLLLEKETLSEQERREYLTLALKKAEQIKERTRALLDFATLTSGQLPIHKTVIDVRTMIDQLKEELSAIAKLRVKDGYRDLSSEPESGESEIPHSATIFGDVGLLARLFDNLLSNLQKHGDMARLVNFWACLQDENLLIETENIIAWRTGTKRHSPESTSLGLKICACILELHGGRIETAANGETYRTRIFLPVRGVAKQVIKKHLPRRF